MKIKECGRSMVEMLGVLAIVGVLSIGGIYMYTLVMRHYRANEILDDVRMFGGNILHRNKKYEITKGQDDSIPLEEFEKAKKIANTMRAYQWTEEVFGVVVDGVDAKTCRLILNKTEGADYTVRVPIGERWEDGWINVTGNPSLCGEDGTTTSMDFLFQNNADRVQCLNEDQSAFCCSLLHDAREYHYTKSGHCKQFKCEECKSYSEEEEGCVVDTTAISAEAKRECKICDASGNLVDKPVDQEEFSDCYICFNGDWIGNATPKDQDCCEFVGREWNPKLGSAGACCAEKQHYVDPECCPEKKYYFDSAGKHCFDEECEGHWYRPLSSAEDIVTYECCPNERWAENHYGPGVGRCCDARREHLSEDICCSNNAEAVNGSCCKNTNIRETETGKVCCEAANWAQNDARCCNTTDEHVSEGHCCKKNEKWDVERGICVSKCDDCEKLENDECVSLQPEEITDENGNGACCEALYDVNYELYAGVCIERCNPCQARDNTGICNPIYTTQVCCEENNGEWAAYENDGDGKCCIGGEAAVEGHCCSDHAVDWQGNPTLRWASANNKCCPADKMTADGLSCCLNTLSDECCKKMKGQNYELVNGNCEIACGACQVRNQAGVCQNIAIEAITQETSGCCASLYGSDYEWDSYNHVCCLESCMISGRCYQNQYLPRCTPDLPSGSYCTGNIPGGCRIDSGSKAAQIFSVDIPKECHFRQNTNGATCPNSDDHHFIVYYGTTNSSVADYNSVSGHVSKVNSGWEGRIGCPSLCRMK